MDAKALARHLIVDSLAAMGSVLPFVVFSATSWLSGPFALNVGGLAALLGVFATVLGLSMRRRIPNATEVHVLERWLALQTDAGRDFSVALAAGGVACLGVHLLGGTAFDEGAWAFLFSTSFIALVGGGVLQGQLEGTLKPFIADAFRATLAPTGVLRRSWQTTTVGRRLGILTAGAFGSAFFIARASGESVNIAIGFCAAALPVAWAAQLFSRGISHAARSARLSLESLTGGLREPPDWMGPDELGVLALRVAQVVEDQGSLTGNLVGSAEQLSSASRRLGHATMQQNENLARQAAAIQQTEVTAHEIQQTSSLALQKTALVLQEAERAESITEAGELAIEESLSGLTNISAEVDEMARSIRALGERTRAIVSITTTVKELADQSNMLALNAAIEAVRSGEHGRGFAVVAREIRALADQSLQATRQVRALLDSIASAIQATVAISDRGNARVRESVVQVQSSGESLRELSSIVRDNAQAMRQISAAVGQQNTGISQVFDAIRELSGMMDVTLGALESSESAAFVIDEVAAKISSSVAGLGQTETSHQSVDEGRTARAAA